MCIRTVAGAALVTSFCVCVSRIPSLEAATARQEVDAPRIDRVRALDPALRAAVERGINESATFARLVDRLQRSDVVVYLDRNMCPGLHTVGCVVSVSRAGNSRFIRINLVLMRQAHPTALKDSEDRLVAQIGHELQHATEIAGDPSIVDKRSLARAYDRKSAYQSTGGYETDAAIQAGADVLKELTRQNPGARFQATPLQFAISARE
jgi:hypothetical protein